jgi:hypothetical protein
MLLNLSSKLHDTILIEEIQRISDGKVPLSQERTYGYQLSIAVAFVTAAGHLRENRADSPSTTKVLNGQNLAIVDGFDCCHSQPGLTLPLGSQIRVDFEQKRTELIARFIINPAN